VAALRGRGFHKGSGGRQTSKFPQNCLRAYTPACVKPLVIGSAFFSLFPYFSFLLNFGNSSETSEIVRKNFGNSTLSKV